MKKTFRFPFAALLLGLFCFNQEIYSQTSTDTLWLKLNDLSTSRVLMIEVKPENSGDFPNSVLFPMHYNDTLNDITTGSLKLVQSVFSDYYANARHANISFIKYKGKNIALSTKHSHGKGNVVEHLKKIFARQIGDNADGVVFDSLNFNTEGQNFLPIQSTDTFFTEVQNVKINAVDFSPGDKAITAFIIKGSAVYFSEADIDSIFATSKSVLSRSEFPRGAYLVKVQETTEDIPGMSGGLATFTESFGEDILLGVQTNMLEFGTNVPGVTIKFLCITPVFGNDLEQN